MEGLPGTLGTGGFLVCTHNGDNVMQLYEKLEKRTHVPSRMTHAVIIKCSRERGCSIDLMCTWHEITIRDKKTSVHGAQEIYKYIYASLT